MIRSNLWWLSILARITRAYLSHAGPNGERHAGLILLFHRSDATTIPAILPSIISRSIACQEDCFREPLIRYVSTLGETRPLAIDHHVTAPLPNFKYAYTSQLVTVN